VCVCLWVESSAMMMIVWGGPCRASRVMAKGPRGREGGGRR